MGAVIIMAADGRQRGPIIFLLTAIVCTGARGDTIEHWAPDLTLVSGSQVTLNATYTGQPTEINWKVNGNRLVDYEVNPYYEKFYRLNDRAAIAKDTGNLTIRNLKMEDSAVYRAEALVNNIYQYTNVRITVLDCPEKPIITYQTIEKNVELRCVSSSPNVTYGWWNKTGLLSQIQMYNTPQSKEEVNLTCVVENKVCKSNTSITIPAEPSERSHTAAYVPFIISILVAGVVIYKFCTRKKDVQDADPGFPRSSKDGKDENFGSMTLSLSHVRNICYFCVIKDGENLLRVEINNNSEELLMNIFIESCSLTINPLKPSDYGIYTAEVLLNNGHRISKKFHVTGNQAFESVCAPEEEPRAETIHPINGAVRLSVSEIKDVKEIHWNKHNDYLLTVCIETPTNNLLMNPHSLILNSLTPKDGGSYKVDVYNAEKQLTSNLFNIEVVKLEGKPKKVKMMVKKKLPSTQPQSGQPEAEVIGSITLHPSNTRGAWKKDQQQLNLNDERFCSGKNGDLTITGATSADRGLYSFHCEDVTEEFHLSLQSWKDDNGKD